jgi:hypothetical protein
MAEWQDISTAPKDGTVIDVWVNDPDGPHRQTNVFWNDGYWVLRRNRWSSVEAFFDEKGVPKIKITHWMPLPPPPVTNPAEVTHDFASDWYRPSSCMCCVHPRNHPVHAKPGSSPTPP